MTKDDQDPRRMLGRRRFRFDREAASALVLSLMLAASVVGAATGVAVFRELAAAALGVYAILVSATVRWREAPFLLAAASVGVAAACFAKSPWPVVLEGASRGAEFAALVLVLSFLQEPAVRSRAIARCGEFLARQGPGWRYFALSLGAHLFGVVLSLAVLTLLGHMAMRGNTLELAGGDRSIRAIRTERMGSAVLRGFGCVPMWSPTSVSVAITLSLFPQVSWAQFAPFGLGLAAGGTLLGWVLDRLKWRGRARVGLPQNISSERAIVVMAPLLLLVGAVFAGVGLSSQVAGWNLSVAVQVVVPLIAAAWLAVQGCRRRPAGVADYVGRHLLHHCGKRLPLMRYDVVMLASAGFVGVGVAALVPPAMVGGAILHAGLPPLALLIGVMLAVYVLGELGVNPIVTAAIVTSAILQLDPPPVPQMALLVAIIGGMAMFSVLSPLAGSVIMTAAAFGVPIRSAGYRWNAAYAFGLMAGVIALMESMLIATPSQR